MPIISSISFSLYLLPHIDKSATARNKIHRNNNNQNNKWHRRRYKLMKHRKLKPNHNHSDTDGGNNENQQQNHKAKFRSGFQHQTGTATAINSKFNTNSYRSSPPYIQAHINFFDTNTNDDGDDSLKLNKFQVNSFRQNKWPNLSRLQTQLHQDIIDDSLPPYIKKYNRRNKQLINLLEGTISPNYENYSNNKNGVHQRRRQKNHNKWIERNLFEDQRQPITQQPTISIVSATTISSSDQIKSLSSNLLTNNKNAQSEPNALPGEHLSISSDELDDTNHNENHYYGGDKKQKPQNHSNYPVSPKVDSFLFHRVASPKLVGTGTMGTGLIKQRLPFVAITDKRIGEARQRKVDNTQNILPLP